MTNTNFNFYLDSEGDLSVEHKGSKDIFGLNIETAVSMKEDGLNFEQALDYINQPLIQITQCAGVTQEEITAVYGTTFEPISIEAAEKWFNDQKDKEEEK